MEILGRRQDSRPDDGPRRGRLHRDREEDQEEVDLGLLVGEPAVPQLVGVPVLSVRGTRSYQCYR